MSSTMKKSRDARRAAFETWKKQAGALQVSVIETSVGTNSIRFAGKQGIGYKLSYSYYRGWKAFQKWEDAANQGC